MRDRRNLCPPLVRGLIATAALIALFAGGRALAVPKNAPSVCRGEAAFDTTAVEQAGSGDVQVVYRHDCSAQRVHIVHVIDAPRGFSGPRMAFTEGEIRRTTTALNLGSASGRKNIRVAIVTVREGGAELSLGFTNDITHIIRHRVRRHDANAGCLTCGLSTARDALSAARGAPGLASQPAEFVMLHAAVLDPGRLAGTATPTPDAPGTPGAPGYQPSWREIVAHVDAMRAEGISFISPSREISTPGYQIAGGQSATMIFRNIGVNHSRTALRALEMHLDLDALALRPRSDAPPAEIEGNTLRWRFDSPPTGPITLTLGAHAPPGQAFTLTLGTELSDIRRHKRSMQVTHTGAVLALPPTATPAPGTPSPTASPVPPTRTPGPTPTLPGSRPPAPAFLPLIARDPCAVSDRRLDVVLVVDTSHSMRGAEHDYLGAVSEAGLTLLDLLRADAMRLPTDTRRIALVRFAGTAQTVLAPTSDWSSATEALRAIASTRTDPLSVTRIDAGLREALRVIDVHGRPGLAPAIVFVTDGTVHPHYFDAAMAAALDAHARGITVFTVGVGQWYEARLLEGIAGSEERFAAAEGEDDLPRVFSRIGHALRCGRG